MRHIQFIKGEYCEVLKKRKLQKYNECMHEYTTN